MRFLSFVLPVTILFPTAISQDLFLDDNSLDMLPLQDPSQDLLASQDLPETSDSITDANDDDFFTDSDTMDSFSAESPDFFSDLTASCSTGNEQSLNKLRSRDEEVCPPKSPALSQRKPPTGDLDEAVRKWREFILGVPVDTSDDLSCRPDYPHHLCCFTVSDPVGDRTLPGFFYYETVSGCYRASTSYISICVRPYNMCCQYFATIPDSREEELVGRSCYKIPQFAPPVLLPFG